MSAPPPRRAIRGLAFIERQIVEARRDPLAAQTLLTAEQWARLTPAGIRLAIDAQLVASDRQHERQLKIALLDALDYASAKAPAGSPLAHRCQMVRDFVEIEGPGRMARERAPMMRDETIAAALAAWPGSAGAKGKRQTHDGAPVQRKMQAASDLLSDMGVDASESSLAVLWSHVGPPAWRAEKDSR